MDRDKIEANNLIQNSRESKISHLSKKKQILGSPQSKLQEKDQKGFQKWNSPEIYFVGHSDIAIKKSPSALKKDLVLNDIASIDEEKIQNVHHFFDSKPNLPDNQKSEKLNFELELQPISQSSPAPIKNKNPKKFKTIYSFIEVFEVLLKGKVTQFQKPFSDRVLNHINKLHMRTLFVRYYHAIFIARIMLIMTCLITLANTPRFQVFIVLASQAIFAALVVWYQTKLKFLEMSSFYIFNHIFHEVTLTIFLVGAQILSFNEENIFSEGILISIEFVMTLTLVLSIFVEMLTLLGLMITFLVNLFKLMKKGCKKKIN